MHAWIGALPAFEESRRTLQGRLTMMLGGPDGEVRPAPSGLLFTHDAEWLRQGGREALDAVIAAEPNIKMSVIDTLAMIAGARRSDVFLDYETAQHLRRLAEQRQIAFLLVQHLQKAQVNLPVEELLMRLGFPAVADAIWLLRPGSGDAKTVLHIAGQDIERRELVLHWDAETYRWSITKGAEGLSLSPERSEIVTTLNSSASSMTPKEVAHQLKKPSENIKQLMWKMRNAGQIVSVGAGKYAASEHTTRPRQ